MNFHYKIQQEDGGKFFCVINGQVIYVRWNTPVYFVHSGFHLSTVEELYKKYQLWYNVQNKTVECFVWLDEEVEDQYDF
jgi:dTDP-4-dehydrorhamnose 3,5-epimerase-like enzyme